MTQRITRMREKFGPMPSEKPTRWLKCSDCRYYEEEAVPRILMECRQARRWMTSSLWRGSWRGCGRFRERLLP
jgi:hypothetical protein